jgi:hypothetical protein
MKANYRRGGLFMLPGVTVGIILALILSAPVQALLSIGAFGFGTAIILILLGDKRKK